MTTMITQSLIWYLTLQLFALAGFPLAFAWLRHLPSRGYAAAKALGILLSGILLWWGGTMHLLRNTTGATLTVVVILFAGGIRAMRQNPKQALSSWWQDNRAFVLVTEILFAVAFFVWVAVRATQPQLETAGGEKWMEIAYLNAVLRSSSFPPHDPWLSGFAISYYYLGYLLMGMLTRLAAIPASVAFNLCNASWFALAAVGSYGLVYNMLACRPFSNGRLKRVFGALLSPLLMVVTGNGEGLMEVLHARGLLPPAFWAWLDIRNLSEAPQPPYTWVPQRFFWWWQASRTLRDYTPWGDHQEVIDEFPAFSFILGDMHPHVLALPFVLLAVALALNHYRAAYRGHAQRKSPWGVGFHGLLRSIVGNVRSDFLGTAIILGSLGFLNTWDFPIYWAVMVGAIVMGRWRAIKAGEVHDSSPFTPKRGGDPQSRCIPTVFEILWGILPQAIALGILSVLCYLPFWIGLRSQAGGILPNLFNATRAQQFAVMFAPLLVPVAGVILGAAWRVSHAESAQPNASPFRFWSRLLVWALGLIVGIAGMGLVFGIVTGYPQITAVLKGEPVPGFDVPPDVFASALWQRLLNPWVALLLALGIGAAIAVITSRSHTPSMNNDRGFPLLLTLIGLLLTLAPEFVFLKDVFWTRMNTIFKFYFQAWVLWSLAGAWQIAQWAGLNEVNSRLDPSATLKMTSSTAPGDVSGFGMTDPSAALRMTILCLGALAVSITLICVGLVYTLLAVPARAQEHGVPWTLDGAAWVADAHPYDWQAIQWLNAHIAGHPVIVEAPADQHRAYAYEGRVSALTGLPTLLGWAGHERQWRGNYDEQTLREAALEILFTTPDPMAVRGILADYNVKYIYIGPVEKRRYPAEGLAKFAMMFPPVYRNDGVVIYEVTSTDAH
jgi:YYY domain-containing protein